MELTYLYHSGFVLSGKGYTLVFDYFEDSLSPMAGVLHDVILSRPGRFYVFSSHFHADHFNKDILSWREQRKDIIYIFSRDIYRRRRAGKEDAVYLRKGEIYQDELLTVKAFGSTDVGVSFLIKVEGKNVFHAGDLNNWHWKDESTEAEWRNEEKKYLRELDEIYSAVPEMDIVMFPVDPRLGSEYMRGACQFVKKIKTHIFVPMHFDESYTAAATFRSCAEQNGCRMIEISRRGQSEQTDE